MCFTIFVSNGNTMTTNKNYDLEIDGIKFAVTHKKMKNLRMRLISPNTIAVSVPLSTSKKQAQNFIKSNIEWAKAQIKKSVYSVPEAKLNNAPPDYIYHLGVRLPVVYIAGDKSYIRLDENNLTVYSPTVPERDTVVNTIKELQRDVFKKLLDSLVPDCERAAHTHALEWRIKDMRTKWGTCNITYKRIWLRLDLISYPTECIKAVMLHELTHLYEAKHNDRFYCLLNQFCPEYENADIILKNHTYTW